MRKPHRPNPYPHRVKVENLGRANKAFDKKKLHVLTPNPDRPETRGDCENGPRPCGFVTCRYHLLVEALETGNLLHTFPGADVDEIPETCALDAANRGGLTLEQVGDMLNVSRERIRQLESIAMRKLRNRSPELVKLLRTG